MGDVLPRKLQDMRRIIAHQVMQTAVVALTSVAAEAPEFVQENDCLIAIADADFQDVQLFGKRTSASQTVPELEQLQDQLARGFHVAGVRLSAGQCRFVAFAGGLLPERKRLPIQAIEAPDEALAPQPPRLQRETGRI